MRSVDVHSTGSESLDQTQDQDHRHVRDKTEPRVEDKEQKKKHLDQGENPGLPDANIREHLGAGAGDEEHMRPAKELSHLVAQEVVEIMVPRVKGRAGERDGCDDTVI